MKGILLDTHIWLWYCLGSQKLPNRILEAIDNTPERCWLSPISIWEAGLLVRRRRLEIRGSLGEWVNEARQHLPWLEAPMNGEIALASLEIELPSRDPADRFLAATAQVFELELATSDGDLLDSPAVPTLAI